MTGNRSAAHRAERANLRWIVTLLLIAFGGLLISSLIYVFVRG